MSRYIDADKLLEVLNGFTKFHHIETLTVGTFVDMIADIPTAKVREDSWAMGKDNRYLDLTKLYEYFRSKEITELKFYDNDIVHEFKMVVRGEWKPKTKKPKQEIFICSVCGGWAYSPWIGSNKNPKPNWCKYNYCPNCGAEMRGEQDDRN